MHLDLEEALTKAASKVVGIDSILTIHDDEGIAVDWDHLHCQTFGWTKTTPASDRWPGVGNSMIDIWFTLNGTKLEPKRVEWDVIEGTERKHWP